MINYGRITDYKVMHETYSRPTYEMTIEGVHDNNCIDAISEILNHLDMFSDVNRVKELKSFLNSKTVEAPCSDQYMLHFSGRCNGKEVLKRGLNAIYGTQILGCGIDKVVYNNPATIILWKDGTKTVVKCSDNDIYDPEKGLAMAICKKLLGNKGNYYNFFKKWVPESEMISYGKVGEDVMNGLKDGIKQVGNNLADTIARFAEEAKKTYFVFDGDKNE